MTPAPAESRAQRRKRVTEARLLDAALEVFCARGYDAATTAEMARVADVAAGTFYLYFRDKRAAYESIARHAAHDLLDGWRATMRPGMSVADTTVLGLRLAARFWRADRERARLILEGGPSFGSEGHLRFVDEMAAALAAIHPRRLVPTRALALMVIGLAVELGRLIVANPDATGDVDDVLRLARRSLACLDRAPRQNGRRSPAR